MKNVDLSDPLLGLTPDEFNARVDKLVEIRRADVVAFKSKFAKYFKQYKSAGKGFKRPVKGLLNPMREEFTRALNRYEVAQGFYDTGVPKYFPDDAKILAGM